MLLLNKNEIKSVFSMKDAIEANKKCYRLCSEGKAVIPLRTNIPASEEEGAFLFMPAYIAEMKSAGLKVVNIFPNNSAKGRPTTTGQVMLIDGTTGEITAMMDGTYVTALRTGAASGAAFDLLGIKDAKVGALVGTGGQAACQLEAMLAARKLTEVRVAARNFEKTEMFVNKMKSELASYGAEIKACRMPDEAVDGADLIALATVATSPVFNADRIKKGAVLSGVGSYLPYMQEIDPRLLARADGIYFDSKEAVIAESGDIQKPLADGTIRESDFTGDIGDYILGKIPGRRNDDEIIVFKNVGIGALDLVAAAEIYSKASVAGVGTVWEVK